MFHSKSWILQGRLPLGLLLSALLVLLNGCTQADVDPPLVAHGSRAALGQCSPIDPSVDPNTQSPPPCFWVDVSDGNLLTLHWELTNATTPYNVGLYVYLQEDLTFHDIGFKAADCNSDPSVKSCSTTVRAPRGDVHQYTIAVRNNAGDRVTVSASVDVQEPPPVEVMGGGPVDMLNPTAQTFSWSHLGACVNPESGAMGPCDPSHSSPVGRGWVEYRRSNVFAAWSPPQDPSSGQVTLHFEDPDAGYHEPGEYAWEVRYCAVATSTDAGPDAGPDDEANKLCSANSYVHYQVAPSRWTKPHRMQVAPGSGPVQLTHNAASGNVWVVTSETLVRDEWGHWVVNPNAPSLVPGTFGDWSGSEGIPTYWDATGTTYTIPQEKLTTEGHYRLTLTSCQGLQACTNRVDVVFGDDVSVGDAQNPVSVTSATYRNVPGPYSSVPDYYLQGNTIGYLSPLDPSTGTALIDPATDSPYPDVAVAAVISGPGGGLVPNGTVVAVGDSLAYQLTQHSDVLHLLVDGSVVWSLDRPWTDDFAAGTAYAQLGEGDPLDISYGPPNTSAAGIWHVSEFASGAGFLSEGGVSQYLSVPGVRTQNPTTRIFEVARPFLKMDQVTPWEYSSLQERVTSIDNRMWFTQGGLLDYAPVDPENPLPNFSRVIAFDPAGVDDPATEQDDRVCPLHVPMDDAEIVGADGGDGRVYLGAYRNGYYDDWAIIYFSTNPQNGTMTCSDDVDYTDLSAVEANPPIPRCAIDESPDDTFCMKVIEPCLDALGLTVNPNADANRPGCIETVSVYDRDLDAFQDQPAAKLGVGHVAYDSDGSLWFIDPHGSMLSHLEFDNQGNPSIHAWPIPTSVMLSEVYPITFFYGGYPWTLRVVSDPDHPERDAVYFGEFVDNDIVRFDKVSRFDQIHLPFANGQVNQHSIDIDEVAQRLWFTLANETASPMNTEGSTIGYIDLATWNAHLQDPVLYPTVSGTTYSGLASINTDNIDMNEHFCARGIRVNPQNGNIALAGMRRRQIVELRPKPGFR